MPPGWQNHSVSVFFYSFWGLCFSILSPPWIEAELSERTMSWESEFGPTWAAPGPASSWVGGGIHTDQERRTLKSTLTFVLL